MPRTDSALDSSQIAYARALLDPLRPRERMWPVLCAATLLAISTLAFAAAMIMAPPIVTEHVAPHHAAHDTL
jgi:hypothetical protein